MTENNFYCLRFYVTYRCNSKCSYCNVWKDEIFKNIKELSLEDAKLLLKQSYNLGTRYVDFTGGEPTLYPYLKEVIDYAKKLGMKTEVTSNCISSSSKQKMLEVASIADKFNTSLDTLNDEAYHKIRGVDCCQNVKATVRDISTIRSPKIMTVVTKDNINQLDDMIDYAKSNKALIYLSPMFPYIDKNGNYQISEYIDDIISKILKPYTVVLLHFMEFFKTSMLNRLPPCSANQHTLTIAPNGNIVLPCYHAIKEQIPWQKNLEKCINSPKFQEYIKTSGNLNSCKGCCVIPYFGISFNYQLNKYFLLQSFSEKLYHLKRDGLNELLPNLNIDEETLNKEILELMEIASSMSYKVDIKAYRNSNKELYPAQIKDNIVTTPIYNFSLSINQYNKEKNAKDCWNLSLVPHHYFDKFIQNIIKPILENKISLSQKDILLKDLIEFQIKWWKFYIIKYFKLDKKYSNQQNQNWLNNYLNKINNLIDSENKKIITEGLNYLN